MNGWVHQSHIAIDQVVNMSSGSDRISGIGQNRDDSELLSQTLNMGK